MIRIHTAAMIALVVCLVSPPPLCAADGDDWGPVVCLHASSHLLKGDPCLAASDPIALDLPCDRYTTGWPLNESADVYLVVAKGDEEMGIASVSVGIQYDGEPQSGVDVYSWVSCASGPFISYPDDPDPDAFPAAGGGIRITWDAATDCQRKVVAEDGVYALAGVFYAFAYSADALRLTPNYQAPSTQYIEVGDCEGTVDQLISAGGGIDFGGFDYWPNPCIPSPVNSISWSRLKSMYGRSEDPR